MSKDKQFILWFKDLTIEDVPLVGGKNASLGEMYRNLTKKRVNIPNGFAVTAYAYRYFLKKAKIEDKIRQILSDLDTRNMQNLAERGRKVRGVILQAHLPEELKSAIVDSYKILCREYGKNTDVAVEALQQLKTFLMPALRASKNPTSTLKAKRLCLKLAKSALPLYSAIGQSLTGLIKSLTILRLL